MFELISAHKRGKKTKFLSKFAVKSWEDKILGALVRCRRKRIKDHAKLENKALALFFLVFLFAPQRSSCAKMSIPWLSSGRPRDEWATAASGLRI